MTWRKMFGGVGLYADGVFFALLDDDTLYFKTDETTRAEFEARGLKPFQPFGPDTPPMAYHEVPADVLENVNELKVWMARAVAVAVAKQKDRRKPARKWKESRPGAARKPSEGHLRPGTG